MFGLVGAAAVGRLLGGLLYGVGTADPLTALGVVGVLGLLGVIATCLPVWRASLLDPAALLRRG